MHLDKLHFCVVTSRGTGVLSLIPRLALMVVLGGSKLSRLRTHNVMDAPVDFCGSYVRSWPNPAVEPNIAGCRERKIADCHEEPDPTQSRQSSFFRSRRQRHACRLAVISVMFQANFIAARMARYCCNSRKKLSPRVPCIVTDSSSLVLKPPFVIFAEPITAVYLSPLSK